MRESRFPLCDGEQENQFAELILAECVRGINQHESGAAECISIVLTGSFSRGEGSILRYGDGTVSVLGDMEFLVVFVEGENLPVLEKALKRVSLIVQQMLHKSGIFCEVEFTPVCRDYFRRLRPTIFNYELKSHGKVVFGEEDLLQEIPEMSASHIPKLDAFNLLGNRTIEQLILYRSLRMPDAGHSTLKTYYQLLKIYLDIAGSFLIFADRYEPFYKTRLNAFSRLKDEKYCEELSSFFTAFYPRLEEATSFKLNPGSVIPSEIICIDLAEQRSQHLLELYFETIGFVRTLWNWEIAQLSGGSGNEREGREDRFLESFPLKVRIRGWVKLWWIALRHRYRVSLPRTLSLFFKGTPQALLYAAATRLYLSLGNGSLERTVLQNAERYMPVPGRTSSPEELMKDVEDTWVKFIRNS